MPTPFLYYTLAWMAACVVAAGIAFRRRDRIALARGAYWRFLARPWRLATFAVAGASMVVVAPYTGDYTWDWFDAGFMSVLAFTTAPWALGALWRAARGRLEFAQAYVAACTWMLSASWSYDLYVWLRDGDYPGTWAANIAASSVLYAAAGLFWSLEHRPGRGVTFAFLEPEWFADPAGDSFGRVFWYAVPFMALIAATLVYFVTTA